MNSQELRALQEAYSQVYELDEAAIYKRGGKGQTTETPLQIYGNSATAREKKKLHNIPKGRIGANEVGDYDRGSGNAAKRRAAALTKPEVKKFPNRLTRSDGQGIKDSYEYDLYDIILSHLLDEGYADTEQAAEVIMVNMSEDWRESIVEGYQEPKFGRKDYIKKLSKRGGMGMGTPEDPHGYRDPGMAKVGAEFSKRKTAGMKAKKSGEPDTYRSEKESQSKNR